MTGVQQVYSNDSPINDIVLSHGEGELIACDESGRIMIYDLVASKVRQMVLPHLSAEIGFRSMCVSNLSKECDVKYLCASDSSGGVFVYKINEQGDLNLFSKFQAHNDYILKCAISNNSRKFATCSADKTVKIYDVDVDKGFNFSRSLIGHTKWVWDCEFIMDSETLITVSTDTYLKVWDLNSGIMRKNSTQHLKGVICLALNDRQVEEN